jgi:hypothetical protein
MRTRPVAAEGSCHQRVLLQGSKQVLEPVLISRSRILGEKDEKFSLGLGSSEIPRPAMTEFVRLDLPELCLMTLKDFHRTVTRARIDRNDFAELKAALLGADLLQHFSKIPLPILGR